MHRDQPEPGAPQGTSVTSCDIQDAPQGRAEGLGERTLAHVFSNTLSSDVQTWNYNGQFHMCSLWNILPSEIHRETQGQEVT